jgi:polar amino acid transport system substrate-binding protein
LNQNRAWHLPTKDRFAHTKTISYANVVSLMNCIEQVSNHLFEQPYASAQKIFDPDFIYSPLFSDFPHDNFRSIIWNDVPPCGTPKKRRKKSAKDAVTPIDSFARKHAHLSRTRMTTFRSSRLSHVVSLSITLFALGVASLATQAAEPTSIEALKKNASIYATVPQKYKDAGVINAATESDYPPFDFLDEQGQLIGADIDISMALGKVMGVPIKNINTDFSAIIPGIQAGRFDVGISSMGDYVAREKTVDFVDYYRGGTSFLIKAGTAEPKQIADLCGTAVGALKGTSSETQANDTSKRCTDMGKPAITVSAYPTQSAAILALTSGRIQSVSGDSAANGYSAKNPSLGIKNVGFTVYNDRPYYGIAIPKDSPLFAPFMAAMKVVIDSGVYMQILKKWGIEDGALAAPMKNQASPG